MGIKNFYMKTFHQDAYEKIEKEYQNSCRYYSAGLNLFLQQKKLKNDPDDYDMKIVVSEHEEDIKIYHTYTQRSTAYPDAVWLYTKEHPLDIEVAQFVNENEELFKLTQEFYKATKNTTPGQYRAFGLTEKDRNIVDAELSERKTLLIDYLNVINQVPEPEEEERKVEAYTIDVKENKNSYLDSELNPNEKVFVIDDGTWGDYINHVNDCINKRIRIKDDFNLIHSNKFLITRCYKETSFDGGITIKSIYEIKKDSPLKQYVSVCNTARRFAEVEYPQAYQYFVDQGIFKPYDPKLSLIDCLYIVSHVEMLKKRQAEGTL